jgi:hypothetical protein
MYRESFSGFESEKLLEIFRPDANIAAFWRIKDHARVLIWEDRLDLIKIP